MMTVNSALEPAPADDRERHGNTGKGGTAVSGKIQERLLRIAKANAGKLRRQTAIPGWITDESMFPEADYRDVVNMLEEAYRLGVEDGRSAEKE